MQPPPTTAITGPNNFAANPLSNAPNQLEDPTNMELTDATRPFMLSGVFNCKIVDRITTEIPSAIPLKNKASSEMQKEVDKPKAMIHNPKQNTAINNFLPAFCAIGK